MQKGLMLSLIICLTVQFGIAAEHRPLAGYKVLVLERFTVDPDLLRSGLPKDYETVLQKGLLARLVTERIFDDVIDAESQPLSVATPAGSGRLIASGTITDFSKGSRSARVLAGVPFGAAKLKVRLTFRDAETGKEVLTIERTGKFYGVGHLTGGSADKARTRAAAGVIDGLMKEIKKAR